MPNVKGLIRGGLRLTRRAVWALSDRGCRVSMALGVRPAGLYVLHGRIRERQGNWRDASSAYDTAIARNPGRADWHARRAGVAQRRKKWDEAIAFYQRALQLQPDVGEWRARLAGCQLCGGAYAEAIDSSLLVLQRATDRKPLVAVLAKAYEALGQWPEAVAALTELVEAGPRDNELRRRLYLCLESQFFVPFRLDRDGTAYATGSDEAVFESAVGHLRHIIGHAANPLRSHYYLGGMYERHGRLDEAADHYRKAVKGLDSVDSTWIYSASRKWQFQLDYVQARSSGRTPADKRLSRRAIPQQASSTGTEQLKTAGYFTAQIDEQGLQFKGFLRPGITDSVHIYIDGKQCKAVVTNPGDARPTFTFELGHPVLAKLPQTSRLTLLADDLPLMTLGGATVVDLEVPGGTDTFTRTLESGTAVTKRGRWALTDTALSHRQSEYLRVYDRAKRVLREQYDKPLFLFYGTLLGFHREGRFIPGDDDFDVAYLADSTGPAALKRELQEHSLMFLREGLDVCFAFNGRMIKVGMDNVWIDLIPLWFHDNRAWSFNAHKIGPGDIEPVREVDFQGHPVYVPQDAEAFLADNYGPNWAVPRSDFRYYKSPADVKVLEQTFLKPSEFRDFLERARAQREQYPDSGNFAGLRLPAFPGFG